MYTVAQKKTPLNANFLPKKFMTARARSFAKLDYITVLLQRQNSFNKLPTFPKHCKELKIFIFNILQELPFLISRKMVNKGQ